MNTSDPLPLPDVVTLKLTVFELGILTGVVGRWAREQGDVPAARRLLAKLHKAAEPLYPAGEEPHPHG